MPAHTVIGARCNPPGATGGADGAGIRTLRIADRRVDVLSDRPGEIREGNGHIQLACEPGSPHVVVREGRVEIACSPADGWRLYYAEADGSFYAASHLTALARLGLVLTECARARAEHLAFGTVAPPGTILEGVGRCPLGGAVTAVAGADGEWKVHVRRRVPSPAADGDVSEGAILERLVAIVAGLDPPVLPLLSGGLDSTILTALASSRSRVLATRSAGYWFDARDDAEAAYAHSAAEAIGTVHEHHIPAAGEFLASVILGVAATGEPLAYLQCALLDALLAGTTGSTVVNGQGADAAFAPLPREAASSDLAGLQRRLLRTAEPTLRYVAEMTGMSADEIAAGRKILLEEILGDAPDLYQATRAYLLATEVDGAQHAWSGSARRHGARMAFPFLEGPVLAVADRVSAVVAGREPKHVLREAARRLGVPESIVVRDKRAFGPASSRWAALLRPLAALVMDCDELANFDLRAADTDQRYLVWNLINRRLWRHVVLEGASPANLVEALDQPRRERRSSGPHT